MTEPGASFHAAMEFAEKVAAQPPIPVAMTKQTVNRLAGALDDLASHMDLDQYALDGHDRGSQGGHLGVPRKAQAALQGPLKPLKETRRTPCAPIITLSTAARWSRPGKTWLDSIDPFRGEPWARIAKGTAADVDLAVTAAKRAMYEGPWAKMTATERGKLMLRLADLVAKNAERLAEIEVRDNGKLLAEMRGQVNYHPEWWRYFGGLADKIEGAVMPIDKPDVMAFTRHEPVGVVAALTAWNSPLLFIAWKCAPALAAGCTVVVKPSEFASVSTLEYRPADTRGGFPGRVFNVVTGLGEEAGAALVDHPDIAKITFTGSDATGARIYAQAARTLKRVSLELGGKSPNIVFDDCDLD